MGQLQIDQHSPYRSPREKRGKEAENLVEEIVAENFYNPGKETDIQIQEAHRVPNKMKPRRPTPMHIINQVKNL